MQHKHTFKVNQLCTW